MFQVLFCGLHTQCNLKNRILNFFALMQWISFICIPMYSMVYEILVLKKVKLQLKVAKCGLH